ncbi:hypothetical protein FKW77_007089 [Venturia effusa]|uniref:Uncharacterized protein n=1 Tax=Venturia effusa TaxID=50376 RepID=A0A517LLQ4_9PEZI|nr:hypothetical protein FKW77_007089 [Venturia effusa]
MDPDGGNDDDVLEPDSNLEDNTGQPTDAQRLYNDALFKGTQHQCLMSATIEQAVKMVKRSDKWRNRPVQSVFSDPNKEFKNWGWELAPSSLWTEDSKAFMSSDFNKYGLASVMGSLGLSTDVKHWRAAKVAQSKDWSMNGKNGPALLLEGQPLYWFQAATNGWDSDSSPRAVIMPFMFSPSVRSIRKAGQFPTGTLPPDLKSCSDLVYLMYYLFAQNMDARIDPSGNPTVKIPAPKYVIIPGISTPEAVAVFKHIFQANKLGLTEPPGSKWEANSDEGRALIGTPHGAAISFFLLQHKQQFGVKVIKSISLWHTKRTAEESLTWHMWVEIGDVQPGRTVSLPDEHADWGQAVTKGGDLLCLMGMTLEQAQKWTLTTQKWDGFTVQSRFYDPEDKDKWGWVDDSAQADTYVHRVLADFLDSLHLEPDNEEKWRPLRWEHRKAWAADGKSGPEVWGSEYISQFNLDKRQLVFVVSTMYSPSYLVATGQEPGPAPDLSKPSDLWFLQWYQHGLLYLDFPPVASKSRIPAPKHILIEEIVTEEVVVLLENLAQRHYPELKEPGGQRYDAHSEEGKMLLGTRHGAAVCMFLIQHKEQFGDQTVTGIIVWESFREAWYADFEIGEVKKTD